jgi:hypothetical protein
MQEIFYFLLTKSKAQTRTNKKTQPIRQEKAVFLKIYKKMY